jgi:guanylate kinase
MNNKLIIFTGFSGAGKDTLMNMLLERQKQILRIVSHNSRPIRSEEIEGRDHYFVDKKTFLTLKKQGHFLEHKKYGEHWKGTSKQEFDKVFTGQSVVWRVDMSMAATAEEVLSNKFNHSKAQDLINRISKVLIKGPSVEETLARYKKREGSKANVLEFQKRLIQDEEIWKRYQDRFPYIVINHEGQQEQTLQEILKILNL